MRTSSAAILASLVAHATVFQLHLGSPPGARAAPEVAIAPAVPAPGLSLTEPIEVVLLDLTPAHQAIMPAPATPPPSRRGSAPSPPIATTAIRGAAAVAIVTPRTLLGSDLSPRALDRYVVGSAAVTPLSAGTGVEGGVELGLDAERWQGAGPATEAPDDERGGGELHPSGGGSYESDQGTFTAHINPDGTVDLHDKPNFQLHGLGGSFDLTDWAMRSHGDDPYAGGKRAFLDRTREERYQLGKRYRKQQLARSPELARANVDRALASTTDIPLRKQLLFELWDECAESGDNDLVTGGAAARGMILGAIRTELRGDAAYTADELAELNRHRESAAPFAPYE